MLPSVEAQQRLKVDTTWRQLAAPLLAAKGLVLEVRLGRPRLTDVVHVDGLGAPVGARVRRAGEVGAEDAVLRGPRADKPDEARAEHGAGGEDHFALEGLNRGEGRLELLLQDLGHGRAAGADAVKEEVVVVGHGRVVEDGRLVGLASRHQRNRLGVLVLEFRAGRQRVQLLRHQRHVVGPRHGEAAG